MAERGRAAEALGEAREVAQALVLRGELGLGALAHVDHAALIVPLANCSLYGAAARARPAMVERLTSVSHALYGTKPALVQKHSVPTALRLLESNQPDMRPHTDMLLRTLYGLMGDTLMELAQKSPQGVQQRLREVVQTL